MMSKLLLARGYGLIVGMIALALGSLAWLDSVRFAQEAGIALGATDFGTLMAVKFIGNRNVSTGLLILAFFFLRQHRALGVLLLVRGLVACSTQSGWAWRSSRAPSMREPCRR